jgi:Na+/proline symporter
MPKKDFNDLGGLLGDLWRELSPIVRIGLFLGMAAGAVVTILWLNSYPADNSVRLVARTLILLGLVLMAVGAVVGLLLGVVVETIVNRLRPPKKGRRNQRR